MEKENFRSILVFFFLVKLRKSLHVLMLNEKHIFGENEKHRNKRRKNMLWNFNRTINVNLKFMRISSFILLSQQTRASSFILIDFPVKRCEFSFSSFWSFIVMVLVMRKIEEKNWKIAIMDGWSLFYAFLAGNNFKITN